MDTIQKKTVIIGAGPAGIGTAVRLAESGHRELLVLERSAQTGGIPSRYPDRGKPTFIEWSRGRIRHGRKFAEDLSGKMAGLGIDIRLEAAVVRFNPGLKEIEVVSKTDGCCLIRAEAIVMACGARESTAMERGGVFGQRPARIYHTLSLLQLAERLQPGNPARCAVLGSEALSYATAEKLKHYFGKPTMIDDRRFSPERFFSRFYFFPASAPRRYTAVNAVHATGQMGLEKIRIQSPSNMVTDIESDYLYLSGRLVPNTELLVSEGIPFDAATRRIADTAAATLRSRGIFIVGNMSGGASGGERSYFNGRQAGAAVSEYLNRNE